MSKAELTEEDLRRINFIKQSLFSEIESFEKELIERHLEEPEEYPLDDGAGINDMFAAHINKIDW